jgi:hypothetical protein
LRRYSARLKTGISQKLLLPTMRYEPSRPS